MKLFEFFDDNSGDRYLIKARSVKEAKWIVVQLYFEMGYEDQMREEEVDTTKPTQVYKWITQYGSAFLKEVKFDRLNSSVACLH